MNKNSILQIVALSWTAIQLSITTPSTESKKFEARLCPTLNGGWKTELTDEIGHLIAEKDCTETPLLWQNMAQDMVMGVI